MEGTLQDGVVYAGGDARQRYYDARGYGRPLDDAEADRAGVDPGNGIALSRVEAAHLLARGDLDRVVDGDRRLGFREFLATAGAGAAGRTGFLVRFLVYADLRERGFYLSPAREGWPNTAGWSTEDVDFVVYPRGSGPADGTIAHRVRVVGERERLAVADLSGVVLAVADEESDVTYFDTSVPEVTGSTDTAVPDGLRGDLLADRAVLWDPPADLYQRRFYGRPLPDRAAGRALQLSLVEAAYLASRGAVGFAGTGGSDAPDAASIPLAGGDPAADHAAAVARGRAVEGERFDRRLRTYAALREQGVVPKTGFKFGADFRTYAEVESVDDLGHSELLVRVLTADAERSPRDLALDVRLAHGVRKQMVFALVGNGIEWRSAERFTP